MKIIQLKHTISFAVIVTMMIWGFHFLSPNKHSKFHQKESVTKLLESPEIQYDKFELNKSVPIKISPKITQKAVPEQVVVEPQPSLMDTVSNYWPFVGSVLTLLPSIILKWEEMILTLKKQKHKIKHKKKKVTNDNI